MTLTPQDARNTPCSGGCGCVLMRPREEMTMQIEPIFDSEDELWFAGTYTGLASGPWSQRGEFYAWPDVNGETPQSAQAYQSREFAQVACDVLKRMTVEELRRLAPDYFGAC